MEEDITVVPGLPSRSVPSPWLQCWPRSRSPATEPATIYQMMSLPHSQSLQLCQNVHGFLGHHLGSVGSPFSCSYGGQAWAHFPPAPFFPIDKGWGETPLCVSLWNGQGRPFVVGLLSAGLAWRLTSDQTTSLTRNWPGPWFAQSCPEVILCWVQHNPKESNFCAGALEPW